MCATYDHMNGSKVSKMNQWMPIVPPEI